MDTKKILLMGGLLMASAIVFVQVKKIGTPKTVVANAPAPIVVEQKMAQVLVAEQSVNVGSRISPELLKWQKWPQDALTESLIEKSASPDAMKELTNAVVRAEITAGEPINRRKLVQAGNSGVMSALLKPGMRAVSVRISADTAASGFINPGDRVDIILTEELNIDDASKIYASKTIFENVEVLAIDQTYSPGPDSAVSVVGSIALFQLSQADAEFLTSADQRGDLSLTLRGLSGSRYANAPSAATQKRVEAGQISSLKIIRNGQIEEVRLKDN